MEVSIEIEGLYNGIDFSEKLSRAKFEERNMGHVQTPNPNPNP